MEQNPFDRELPLPWLIVIRRMFGRSAGALRQPFAPPRAQQGGGAVEVHAVQVSKTAGKSRQPGAALFEKFKCKAKKKA